MLFSPDCDHCQRQTTEFKKNIELIKNIQIVMVSFLNFDLLKKFHQDYGIENYPNITVGRDGNYFLGTFYKPHFFPSMFLYNKKGKFVKTFEGNASAKQIAESL